MPENGMAFEVDKRLAAGDYNVRGQGVMGTGALVFNNAESFERSFIKGGLGQQPAGHGPNAFASAALSAMGHHPEDIPSAAHYAHHYQRIEGLLNELAQHGDSRTWHQLRDMIVTGKRGSTMQLSQTAWSDLIDDVMNRKLQIAPSAPEATYEMWTTPFIVDVWRDPGYRISELHGVRGPAPELGTDNAAPARVRAEDSEETYHMRVYAKELHIRWYEGIADNFNYVPELLRQLRMAAMDTEGILAADLVVDASNGIDTTFFSAANRNQIGHSENYGLSAMATLSQLAIETAWGEYGMQQSRENMPMMGEPAYLVASPLAAGRAKSILGDIHADVRGSNVEVTRYSRLSYLTPGDVIEEKYFAAALGYPTGTGSVADAAFGLWMLVGDGMARPPAFIRLRHRDYMMPMILRRNPLWGQGEIESSNHLFATMIGFGQYDPRGVVGSRNGTQRPH